MAQTTLKKENSGYNYKYTDLAQINGWCEANGIRYSQTIKLIEGSQFIETTYTKDGKDYGPFLGAQVIKAAPGGKVNEAQIYGSGLTYARRYSLLMCFGLATDDDDAECYTHEVAQPQRQYSQAARPPQKTADERYNDFVKAAEKLALELGNDKFLKVLGDNGYESIKDVPKDPQKYTDLYKKLAEAKNA